MTPCDLHQTPLLGHILISYFFVVERHRAIGTMVSRIIPSQIRINLFWSSGNGPYATLRLVYCRLNVLAFFFLLSCFYGRNYREYYNFKMFTDAFLIFSAKHTDITNIVLHQANIVSAPDCDVALWWVMHCFTLKRLLQIYQLQVRSCMEYYNHLWDGLAKYQVAILDFIECRARRLWVTRH